jgi:hypothetical protein
MTEQVVFESRDEFLSHLRRLVEDGVPKDKIQARLPYHVAEVDEILGDKPGYVRIFTLVGALTGFLGGLGFTIYTVLSWPILTGGKPIISIPPFLIIAYALTILFGSLATFFGFLILSIVPRYKRIYQPLEEHGNNFVITIEGEEQP